MNTGGRAPSSRPSQHGPAGLCARGSRRGAGSRDAHACCFSRLGLEVGWSSCLGEAPQRCEAARSLGRSSQPVSEKPALRCPQRTGEEHSRAGQGAVFSAASQARGREPRRRRPSQAPANPGDVPEKPDAHIQLTASTEPRRGAGGHGLPHPAPPHRAWVSPHTPSSQGRRRRAGPGPGPGAGAALTSSSCRAHNSSRCCSSPSADTGRSRGGR